MEPEDGFVSLPPRPLIRRLLLVENGDVADQLEVATRDSAEVLVPAVTRIVQVSDRILREVSLERWWANGEPEVCTDHSREIPIAPRTQIPRLSHFPLTSETIRCVRLLY